LQPDTGQKQSKLLDTNNKKWEKRMKAYVAESFGTFWLVPGGRGSAVLAPIAGALIGAAVYRYIGSAKE
jgi:glycerol uptake facilitator-like aquaporin